MTKTVCCRIKPYIQPFERKLALAELASLAGTQPRALSNHGPEPLDFEVTTKAATKDLADRLSYWESITDGQKLYTAQVLREGTVNLARNGMRTVTISQLSLFAHENPLPRRRVLRYGPHGIHEYRGKFFPQLVRALINIAGVKNGGVVADPMCGSGTTLVEAAVSGCQTLGLDMNPLSVLMARTKCALLTVDPHRIEENFSMVRNGLASNSLAGSIHRSYFASLPIVDQNYLRCWFSEDVLLRLDQIQLIISRIQDRPIRDFMFLSLSNIIREVSWQKEDDLRVRKEIREGKDNIDPVDRFIVELEHSVRTLLSFLHQKQNLLVGKHDVTEGDARETTTIWRRWIGKVDAVITSPPYATALPYLDTDRLSLCYFGLLSRALHRHRDRGMIGNREISDRERCQYWEVFQNNKSKLPRSVGALVERVYKLNSNFPVGFRRKNLSSLLAKYFLDMRFVLIEVEKLLKQAGQAFIVVGDNHTIAGGVRMEIPTTKLLADIAASVGFQIREQITMDMLVPRDIFRKNAVKSERILWLRRE